MQPELVCEVKFQEWTKDGSMRQPIFLGLRDDKPAEDVIRERAKPTMMPEKNKEIRIGRQRVNFTHAEKVFWPKQGYTKGDLLAYYRGVANILLPHLKDRPESLHRHPDGMEGAEFFQKDLLDHPAWVKTVPMRSETERKTIHYVLCNDEATLAYLVQLGCIEINPWNSRLKKPDYPDYLIMDLDPEGVPFSAVVRVARAVKDVFDAAGAPSYCKTSGARGLHVYVPLGAKYTYEQVRLFAELVTELVHAKLPNLTSLERGPSRREGKVYLDYPQNRRGATTVAVYSVRPRPGATVSTPLRWEEVKSGLDPRRFTIKTVPQRLAKWGDLWKPVLGPGIDMRRCLKRLSGRRA